MPSPGGDGAAPRGVTRPTARTSCHPDILSAPFASLRLCVSQFPSSLRTRIQSHLLGQNLTRSPGLPFGRVRIHRIREWLPIRPGSIPPGACRGDKGVGA